MKIIAVDPGRTTGLAVADVNLEKEELEYTVTQAILDVEDYWDILYEVKPRLIIIEDFEFRKRSRAGLDLFPVEMIGVSDLYAAKASHQCGVYRQKAAQGKSYYSDNVLKQLGLYIRGVPHGMDASRHLLHWCMFGAGYRYFQGKKKTEEFAKLKG